jgi:DNA-binding NarL/FixJ family response regulator
MPGVATLVGRDAELSQLAGWVDEVAAGRGRAALIDGEPGIGKTALLQAGVEMAVAAGCAVFRSVGDELTQAFPLLPLLQAFGVRPSSSDPRRAEVLRALRGQRPDTVAAAVEALLELVDQLCEQSPVVLVLDDLHWADASTVSTCHRLARSAAQRSLLLITAARQLPRRDDLAQLRRGLGAGLLPLHPLPPAAVSHLVSSLLGAAPGPRLTRLAADAAGNPLYLTELVDALERAGRLTVAAGTAEAADGPAPPGLIEAIGDRLAFLRGPVRETLQAAALLGQECAVADLAAVTRRAPAELAPMLADACAAGVLTAAGPQLAFRHPLVRAVLHDDLPSSVRAAWHRDAAHALRQAGAAPGRIAFHLQAALAGRDDDAPPEWAIDWLVEAAPLLLAQLPATAVALLEPANRHTRPDDSRRPALTCHLAAGLARLGRHDQAAQLAERALSDAADPDLATAAHLALARCRLAAARPDTGLAEITAALARPDLPPRGRAMLHVWAALLGAHPSAGRAADDETAENAARMALSWGERAGDAEITALARVALAEIRAACGDAAAALELSSHAVAEADGKPELADVHAQARLTLGRQLVAVDRVAEAETMLRAVRREAEHVGDMHRAEEARGGLTTLYFRTGRWDDALTEIAAGVAGVASSAPRTQGVLAGVAALIALHRDDTATARRQLADGAAAAAAAERLVVGYLRLACALECEHANAREEALAMLQPETPDTPDVPEVEVWLADAVRLAVALGDRRTAAALSAQAEALPAQDRVPRRLATALHCRGLLHAEPDLLARAADHYAAANAPRLRAQALEEAAALLAGRHDVIAARAPYLAAYDDYTRLGAQADINRMRARFRPYRLSQPNRRSRPRRATGWEALTPAEARVAELVAAGRSNPEIAEELGVSRHTVETHVAKVLAKLRIRSRVEVARIAATRSQPLSR